MYAQYFRQIVLVLLQSVLLPNYPVCIGASFRCDQAAVWKINTHLRLVYLENENDFHNKFLNLLRIVQKTRVAVIILVIKKHNWKMIF